MTRTEFFEKLNTGAKWDIGVAINRTNPVPLDANEIFESVDALKDYLKNNPVAYPGQVVVVLGEDETAAYLVTAVGGEGEGFNKLAATTGSGDVGEALTSLANRVATVEGYFTEGAANKAVADGGGSNIVDTYAKKVEVEAVKSVAEAAVVANEAIVAGTGTKITYDAKGLVTGSADASIADITGLQDALDAKAATTITDGLDNRLTTAEGKISTLEGTITGLTGAMHFAGVKEELPEDLSDYNAGDVIIVGNKEYVCSEAGEEKSWHELGDEGSHLTKTEAESTYLKKTDAENTYAKSSEVVMKEEGKGLSSNDYDAAAVAEVAKIQDKLDASVYNEGIAGKQDVNANLTGIAGMDAEGEGLIRKTAEGYEYDAAEYITDAALVDYAKSADVTSEIAEAVAGKQTAEQVESIIANSTIQGSKIEGSVASATNASTANKVVGILTVGSKTYNGSADEEITAEDLGALTAIPQATTESLGGIKLGFESTATKRAVQLEETEEGAGRAYVEIPAAIAYSAKADGGLEVVDNAFGIKALGVTNEMIQSISTDKLVQGDEELVLNGGGATSSSN